MRRRDAKSHIGVEVRALQVEDGELSESLEPEASDAEAQETEEAEEDEAWRIWGGV